jgi:hypothetical protein
MREGRCHLKLIVGMLCRKSCFLRKEGAFSAFLLAPGVKIKYFKAACG